MIGRLLVGVGCIALTACGSDGGSGYVPVVSAPGATPTPSPSPTASPTPTVSAVPTFDQLAGSTRLEAANGGFLTGYDPPQEFNANAFGTGTPYQFDPAARSIATIDGPASDVFVAAEIDSSAPAGTVRYVKANGNRLLLVQPTPGGIATRWLRFIEHTVKFSLPTRVVGITGVPTPVSQIPTSGTVTFTRTGVVGDAYVRVNGQTTTYSLAPSTVNASINYSTQRVTFTLTLIGRPTSGSDVPLVTITGSTDFDGMSPTYAASSATYAVTANFSIAAALFGTAGAEAGGVFVYRGVNQARTNTLNLVGRIALAQ